MVEWHGNRNAVEYIDVKWVHTDPDYPVRLISEIGPGRYETRRIELFLDGRVDYASELGSSGDIGLALTPIPSLAEINAQAEFSGVEITASDFEALWNEHVVSQIARR
jgi:hypothetical protein